MKRQLTEAAKAAKMIRSILKKMYPGTVFRIRSSNFSMGDSVSIRWEDGPILSEVEKVTGLFQKGYFDGSDDCYYYSNSTDLVPQSKWVSCTREPSQATKDKIVKFIRENFANCEDFELGHRSLAFGEWADSVVYQFFTGAREDSRLKL